MPGFDAENVELVAYHDLDKRPAFKLAMQEVGGRWYLYLSHFWVPGWSILDVTDPAKPELVKFIPGPPDTWTLQVQVADGKMVTSLEVIPPGWGEKPGAPYEDGIYIWDVSNPVEPRRLSQWRTGGTGTHRNYYDGGRYVYCTAAMPGYEGQILVIVDIQDPEQPREAGRWFLPEQWVAGGGKPSLSFYFHGPAYPVGDRAYLPYGKAGMIILDMSDVSAPKLVSRHDFGPAMASSLGIHTVIPLPARKLAVVNTEAIAEGSDENLNFTAIVDVADETNPRTLSLFPIPEAPPGAPYKNLNTRGGRFGPHNQHHYQNQSCLLNRDDIVYLTYFNGGLRIYDIRDPYVPKEIGYFLPHDPTERLGLLPKTLVTQSEDVLVDRRGYAYVTDKNHGLHIVRYTGELA